MSNHLAENRGVEPLSPLRELQLSKLLPYHSANFPNKKQRKPIAMCDCNQLTVDEVTQPILLLLGGR